MKNYDFYAKSVEDLFNSQSKGLYPSDIHEHFNPRATLAICLYYIKINAALGESVGIAFDGEGNHYPCNLTLAAQHPVDPERIVVEVNLHPDDLVLIREGFVPEELFYIDELREQIKDKISVILSARDRRSVA